MALEPQAALEQAALNAIAGLYGPAQAKRTFDGQPPPFAGNVFVSVWHGGGRQAEQPRTGLFEIFGVNVTVTIRLSQPFDRWVNHRDDLEARLNAISNIISRDCWTYDVTNAAEVLASLDGTGQPTGWREGLKLLGYDDVQTVGPEWFHARVDKEMRESGLAQTARFGGNRRIRRLDAL